MDGGMRNERESWCFLHSCSSAWADCLLALTLSTASGHPGRFTSRGRDGAMAHRGHHGDDDCQLVNLGSVCLPSLCTMEISFFESEEEKYTIVCYCLVSTWIVESHWFGLLGSEHSSKLFLPLQLTDKHPLGDTYPIINSIVMVMSGSVLALKTEGWNLDETDDWGFKVLRKPWALVWNKRGGKSDEGCTKRRKWARILWKASETQRGSVCSSMKEMQL